MQSVLAHEEENFMTLSKVKNIDISLINRIKNSDSKAFDTLYSMYWNKLYSFAKLSTSTPEEAEELVQDVFVDIWVRRRKLDVTGKVDSYLYSAIKYKLLDKIRKDKQFEKYSDYVYKVTENYYTDNTEDNLCIQEIFELIMAKSKQLPPKCHEIFVLSRIENKSIDEIAEQLKISPQTVKNQLTKALKFIRPYAEQLAVVFGVSIYI